MKTIKMEKFQCQTCNTLYDTAKDAKLCEVKAVTQDKGAKIGDTVRVTTGYGRGLAVVHLRIVFSREWGHYAWRRYWHTVGLVVDFGNDGSRVVTFDDYEVVK